MKIVLQVHDELVFELPEENLTEANELIKKDMEEPVTIFGVGPIVFPTEGSAGPNYGSLSKL